LGLRSLGGIAIDGRRTPLETHWLIQPAGMLLLAGLGLALRVTQLQLLDPWSVVAAAVVASIPLIVLIGWLDRGMLFDRGVLVPIVFVAAGVGYASGAIGELNRVLDHSAHREAITRITEMHVSHHRRAPDSYDVVLAPWNGAERPMTTEVSSEAYDSLHEGQSMCVTQRDGAFGFAWFTDRPCGSS
jgi:hypothetical protein